MLGYIRALQKELSLDWEFLRSGITSLSLGILGTFVALGIGVALARSLGPAGYGVYSYTLLISSLAIVPIDSGLSTFVLRSGSRLFYEGLYQRLTKVIFSSLVISAFYCSVAYAALALALPMFGELRGFRGPFYVSLALFLTLGLSKPATIATYATNRVNYGQFITRILQPLIAAVCLGGLWLYRSKHGLHLTFKDGVNIQSLSLAATTMLSILVCRHAMEFGVKTRTVAWVRIPDALNSSYLPAAASISYLTLCGVVSFLNAQADMFIIGLLAPAETVGIYKIAATASGVAAMPVIAFNTLLSPQISHLHARGRPILERMLKLSAKITTACAIIFSIIIVIFGRYLISHLFGPSYVEAYWPMVILSVGQVINSAAGSVGNILNMTGNEASALKGAIVSGVFNVLACAVLAYKGGIVGAALATAASTALWNIIMLAQQRKLVGLRCSAVDAWGL